MLHSPCLLNLPIYFPAAKVFNVPNTKLKILTGLRVIVRSTFDFLLNYFIGKELKDVLSVGRVAYIVALLEGQ